MRSEDLPSARGQEIPQNRVLPTARQHISILLAQNTNTMTDAIQIALIASVPGTLAGLASLVASLRNHGKLVGLEKSTNGLLAQSRADSRQLGMSDQRAEDKAKAEQNRDNKP